MGFENRLKKNLSLEAGAVAQSAMPPKIQAKAWEKDILPLRPMGTSPKTGEEFREDNYEFLILIELFRIFVAT